MFGRIKKRIYLDYASATPVSKEVLRAMAPFWSEQFGNAGSIHQEGVSAKAAIEQARNAIAQMLHVRPQGIIFTGSGTESNNLAILGTVEKLKKQGLAYTDMEIISTEIEHASVLEVLSSVAAKGVQIVYAPVDTDGLVQTQLFEKCITKKTILVTCAYANSEVGVVQPISKLVRIVRAQEKRYGTQIYVHTDAAQAPLWLACELDKLKVDMLSLDAGKCCGPKGVGILAMRHHVVLEPYTYGGSQERGLRPGTENTPLIVGAAVAFVQAQKKYEERSAAVVKLRDAFIEQLRTIDGLVFNGSLSCRIANNVNISVPGIDSEFAVVSLDEAGIACSTKSACGGAKGDGSLVVQKMTSDAERALSTIRFSLGEKSTLAELTFCAGVLKEHIEKMRKMKKEFEG